MKTSGVQGGFVFSEHLVWPIFKFLLFVTATVIPTPTLPPPFHILILTIACFVSGSCFHTFHHSSYPNTNRILPALPTSIMSHTKMVTSEGTHLLYWRCNIRKMRQNIWTSGFQFRELIQHPSGPGDVFPVSCSRL